MADQATTLGPTHYDVLGVDVDADADDIKTAFRKLAKELHPDINQEEGAEAQFLAAKEAYEVLTDTNARRSYDAQNRIRRMGFFHDVQEDEEDSEFSQARPSPFRWSDLGQEGRGEERRRDANEPSTSDSDDEPADTAEFMDRLSRLMGNYPGGLRQYGVGGQNDPWGSSSSDMWFKQVEKQMGSPRNPNGGWDDDDNGDGYNGGNPLRRRQDDLFRKRPGWQPPGREGVEWFPPGRADPDDERGSERGPGQGPGRGGDDGFRKPFRI